MLSAMWLVIQRNGPSDEVRARKTQAPSDTVMKQNHCDDFNGQFFAVSVVKLGYVIRPEHKHNGHAVKASAFWSWSS